MANYYNPMFQTQTGQPYVPNYYNTNAIPQYNYNQIPSTQTSGYSTQQSNIWVSGEKEAESYPVGPNNAVTLWDMNNPVIYLKQADATGKPTLKIFDLVERTTASVESKTTQVDASMSYATKEEFQTLGKAMSDYTDILESLKSDIEILKHDMYGIAGKKKSASRKSEVEEDA